MKLWLLMLLTVLAACDSGVPQRSSGSANEGSAAQSAAGGSSNEGKAARSAAGGK